MEEGDAPAKAPGTRQGGSGGLQKRGYAEAVRKAWAEAKKRKMPLRVMFQDEARFGRISNPKACWVPWPMRPNAPMQMVREYVYAFGAVSPKDGLHDSLVLPYADTEAMSLFLKEIGKRYPSEYI